MDDSKKKEKGDEGERKVNSVLKKFLPDDEYHLMEDVNLLLKKDGKKKSTQIDHIVVSRYGIFVIETKHWSSESIADPKHRAYPKKQNKYHIKILRECLAIEADNFFSLCVVVSSEFNKKEIPEGTLALDELVPEIKSKTAVIFDESKVVDLFAKIESFRYAPGPQTDEKHIARIEKSKRTREMPERGRIDKETQTAKLNQTKNLIKTGGIIAILVALFSGVLFYFNSNWNISNITPPSKENIQPTPPPPPPPPNKGASVDAATENFRAQFMQQLARYESEVEPKIDEIRLSHWAGEKYAELQNRKARAIEDFSQGDYLSAREGLRQARVLVESASAEYAERLDTLKREAKVAFENDRAPAAEKAVREVLRLNPADPEMQALQKRVAVMFQVLDLLRQAQVAQTENRPEKEVAALQKVLSIDRSRPVVGARLKELREQLKQQRFADAIRNAQRALDADDLVVAETQIALAKKIFPTSEEIKILQNSLAQVRTEKAFAAQIALGEQAKAHDDWPAAKAYFQLARQLKPGNQSAVENYNVASRVVGIAEKIRATLNQEHRLGDNNVLDSVAAYLRETESDVEVSPSLRKIHAELARKVEAYKTEVAVVVISDNETYIIVRGEGQVGKTARRTIRLRPGRRVFEGARSGYKSKLVTLDIKPGATSVEVIVICDEKI